jgi:hypothetical protein
MDVIGPQTVDPKPPTAPPLRSMPHDASRNSVSGDLPLFAIHVEKTSIHWFLQPAVPPQQ